jgi:hypothetical protein
MGHGGGTPGVSAQMMRFPAEKLTFIQLIASYGIDGLYVGDMLPSVMHYYLPSPNPSEDKSPATTRTLKSVLLGLGEGRADPALFTPEALAAFSPELKQASEFYQSRGPLKSFTLIEQQNGESNQTLRYRTVLGNETWIHQFTLTPDGKITELAVEPE